MVLARGIRTDAGSSGLASALRVCLEQGDLLHGLSVVAPSADVKHVGNEKVSYLFPLLAQGAVELQSPESRLRCC